MGSKCPIESGNWSNCCCYRSLGKKSRQPQKVSHRFPNELEHALDICGLFICSTKQFLQKFYSRHDRSVFQWGARLFSFFYEYFCGISGNFYRKIILIYSVFHLQVSLVERIKFLKKTFSANNSEKPRCLEKPRCVLKMLSLIKPSNGFRFMPICLKCGAQIPSFMNFAVPNDIISNETPCMSLCFYVCYFLGAFVPLSPTKWCD